MQKSLHPKNTSRIMLFTSGNKITPNFFTLRVLCKRCLFPTVVYHYRSPPGSDSDWDTGCHCYDHLCVHNHKRYNNN